MRQGITVGQWFFRFRFFLYKGFQNQLLRYKVVGGLCFLIALQPALAIHTIGAGASVLSKRTDTGATQPQRFDYINGSLTLSWRVDTFFYIENFAGAGATASASTKAGAPAQGPGGIHGYTAFLFQTDCAKSNSCLLKPARYGRNIDSVVTAIGQALFVYGLIEYFGGPAVYYGYEDLSDFKANAHGLSMGLGLTFGMKSFEFFRMRLRLSGSYFPLYSDTRVIASQPNWMGHIGLEYRL